jgi:hypothetical protein
MKHETLDDWTAERLLRGALPPDDAPPGYGAVATLLEAARTEVRTTTAVATDGMVTAMVAAVRRGDAAVVPRARRTRAKVAAAASAGVLALSGGMAAAGALPSTAQQQVSKALAKVGIEVPGRGHGAHGSGSHMPKRDASHDNSGPGSSTLSSHDDNADPAGGAGTTTNHGDCVSQVAGAGGEQVSPVARSDCGKPPTAGGPATQSTTHGTGPSAQVKPDSKPQPTPQGHDGSGNGRGDGGIPSPPGSAKPARPAHESPPPATSAGHNTG